MSGDADIDVAIVGGGPGGLATAAAVLSAFGSSTRVKVTVLLVPDHGTSCHRCQPTCALKSSLT